MDDETLIFVACGQKEIKEINLGKKIGDIINGREGFRAFCAESVHDLIGLTSNIFRNLNICSGFIAILHSRGEKGDGNFETSIWINQEIGIMSFLRHIEGKKIPVIIFKESGIKEDGIMRYIHANPIPFVSDEEVLSKIKKWLLSERFTLIRKTDCKINQWSTIKLLESVDTGHKHIYKLTLTAKNIGERTIRGITFDLEFPKNIPILSDINGILKNVPSRSTNKDYIFFEDALKRFPDILPGKEFEFACFEFEINLGVYSEGLTKKNIDYTFYANDMFPYKEKEALEGKNKDGTGRVRF